VRSLCPTARNGLQAQIPAAKSKPRVEDVREAAVVVWRSGRVLLRQRAAAERWAGMWDFPRLVLDEGAAAPQLVDGVARMTGVRIVPGRLLTVIKHGVTRFRITLECYEARCADGSLSPRRSDLRWVRPTELSDFPLSVSARKLARLIVANQPTSASV
jgi:A/G-specific adenine glycosylase